MLSPQKDPPEVILDEFVAIPVCFFGRGYLFDRYPVWFILLLGFILFRFFDILKTYRHKTPPRIARRLGCRDR
ncbi:MAG: hypothetical protein CO175_07580 [Verrucomicrobia bacterium CG_4_9_14_3_um_filter_43_20]|nr:MAG: hypothetical protein COX01_06720 [Verrucomicrobia bacterium CG22_combo_CG10-13_8_21_14_all_43_17]PIY62064.1 MAG: hypothetical protein COY94_02960 [Verrucomicrobia bacterium CG_4_10_14_0_8_um_filter_43_34]PJA43530.1 MAG: hypothetical protein CO175_07580 [Verrucomicrobia bacterium CG_4_9_14_3_um_filter_43_20]